MPFPITNPTATILSGASLSGAFYVGAGRLVGIQMPAAWTTASLTFQTSQDGSTFSNLYDYAGNEVVVSADTSRQIAVDNIDAGIWMKVRSGTAASAVNQGADRILTMTVRKNALPGVRF